MLEVGKKAPAFTLPDEDGRKVSLKDYGGRWVVLYFYPKDDTPGCTVEACDFTAGLRAFEELEAVVLGCSPDPPETHRKFIVRHGLGIKLLSDPDHSAMERYGAWGEKNMYGRVTMGVIRSTVLVDPAGRIAHHWKKVRAAGHARAVQDRLRELRSARPERR